MFSESRSGAEGDGGEEAAGAGALFAVGEEEVATAGRAEVDDVNVARKESSGEELGAIGVAEVEKDVFRWRLMAGRGHVEPLERIGLVAGAEFVEIRRRIEELREELRGDFGADFVAAWADAGADGRDEVGRFAGEVHLHGADGFGDDAGERPSPTGMGGGDGALFGIDEKYGDAVGGLHAKEEAAAIGDESVATAERGRGRVEDVDDVGVDLFQGDEGQISSAEGGLQAPAVFEDVFSGVPVGEAEVEDFFTVERTDAAGTSGEAVKEEGEFAEGRDLHELEALAGARSP